ncbi:MAG: phosphatase PAP2 family protein [Pirellulaceae bacterium]|nr:phosphatase PAP2 family protein [Pirellulaceae bacterium]
MTSWRPTTAGFITTLRRPVVWAPAIVLFGGTLLFWTTDLDAMLLRPFYSGEAGAATLEGRWPEMHAQPWQTFYDWGELPGLLLGLGGLIVWLAGLFWRRIEGWRAAGLFFFLFLLVGPGVVVNAVCKPCWQRPRPHATDTFGGPRPYVPVWGIGAEPSDASFPSGHAAMGFFLMAPAFVLYRRRPKWAAAFLCLGLAGGAAMGLARMAAGCHFPSDVLWSGGLVYYTGLALAALFRFNNEKPYIAERL